MSIQKIASGLVRPLAPRAVDRDERGTERREDSGEARPARSDEIEISAEGRELAAQASASETPGSESRIDEIRARIERGHYDEPGIAEAVAHRMLESGDI